MNVIDSSKRIEIASDNNQKQTIYLNPHHGKILAIKFNNMVTAEVAENASNMLRKAVDDALDNGLSILAITNGIEIQVIDLGERNKGDNDGILG